LLGGRKKQVIRGYVQVWICPGYMLNRMFDFMAVIARELLYTLNHRFR